jgi:RimJ/RimL family protein N-acetyltransferase
VWAVRQSSAVEAPRLTDGVIVLDGFTVADAGAHLAGEDEEQARRFGWYPAQSILGTVRRAIERWSGEWAGGAQTRAFALRQPEGVLVGGCEIRLRGDGRAALSYWVFPAFRGRGYAGRAARLACEWAFTALGVERMEVYVEPDNVRSRAVAVRGGFREEGLLRARERIGERRRDMVLYARLAADPPPPAAPPRGVGPPAEPLTDGVVVLRRGNGRDRERMLETMRDEHVRRWFDMPREPVAGDVDGVLAEVARGWESRERYDFAIAVPPDDAAVGAIVASRRPRGVWELAYLAGPRGRGRGYVTRAGRLVCDWLFAQGVERIELRTHPENLGSQRVAERLGFVREGRERRSIVLHGERCDALVFSLLPDDPR